MHPLPAPAAAVLSCVRVVRSDAAAGVRPCLLVSVSGRRPSCVLVRRASSRSEVARLFVLGLCAAHGNTHLSVTSVVPYRCCGPGAPPPACCYSQAVPSPRGDGGQLVERGFHLLGGFERAVRCPCPVSVSHRHRPAPMPASGVVGGWVTPSPPHAQAFLPSPLSTSLPILVHDRYIRFIPFHFSFTPTPSSHSALHPGRHVPHWALLGIIGHYWALLGIIGHSSVCVYSSSE